MHVLGWFDGQIVWNDSQTTILPLPATERGGQSVGTGGYQSKQLI